MLNQLIQASIEEQPLFKKICVSGQVINHRFIKQSHMHFFTLTDGQACLACVAFSSYKNNIPDSFGNKQDVELTGHLRFFNKKGQVSFSVVHATHLKNKKETAFDKLKKKLSQEGLFDTQHKKNLPLFPEHIVLVSAAPSAALEDYVIQHKTHIPGIRLSLVPSAVQGQLALQQLPKAIQKADQLKADVMIVMRGGGSQEDLAWFNEEAVVRAIFNTKTPTLCAIGHQSDFSLSDAVADASAATPTAAANHVIEPFKTYKKTLQQRLANLKNHWLKIVKQDHVNTIESLKKAGLNLQTRYYHQHFLLEELNKRLFLLNPIKRIQQGLTQLKDDTNNIITTTQNVQKNQHVFAKLKDGQLELRVISIDYDKEL